VKHQWQQQHSRQSQTTQSCEQQHGERQEQLLTLLHSMTSAPIAHVTINKYIVLSQMPYVIHNNMYNHNKIRSKNNSII